MDKNPYFCPMIFTDTHSHQYHSKFDADRDESIQRAIASGVTRIFLPNIDLDSVLQMKNLVQRFPDNCFPTMGLHPTDVQEDYEEVLFQIKKELDQGKYYAVGEIGIDLYWDKSTLGIQIVAFKQQIQWAKEKKLPIIIHARDSFDEIFEVLDEVNDDELYGIFHCFTGTEAQAQKVIAYGGFKLGIGGVVTFKNSGLDRAIKNIGLQHLVLETDAPFLAPTPHRGKRNESSFLPLIADKLATIYQVPIEIVAEITTENSKAVFGI